VFELAEVLDVPDEDWLRDADPVHPWSSYAPDGLLAMLLDHQSCAPGGFEQVERVGAWDKIVGWAQAQQIREIASLTARAVETARADAEQRAAARAEGEPVGPEVAYCDGEEQAGAEVALMLRIAGVTAAHRVAEAVTLVERYPAALDALEAGAVTLAKVRIIAEQTAQLTDTQAGRVERTVLGRAGGQTPGQLRQSVRRAVLNTDPDAVRRRQQAALRERGVSLYDLPDGMAMLSACLPAAEAVGVYAVLDHHARATGNTDASRDADSDNGNGGSREGGDSIADSDDDRTLDARRADVLVDLVCGPLGHPAAGSTAATSRRGPLWRRHVEVQVRLTVPYTTLFGLDEQPGELAGYGPLPPHQTRELAAAGTWRRILTDPPTGLPIDFGTTRYRLPSNLRDAILTRHPRCQAPGCNRTAVGCDLDHHTPHHRSGTTTLTDTGPYCRRHHRLKQTPRWLVTRDPHGSVTWITPSGHTYTSTPPPVAEPIAPLPRPEPEEPPPF
jgi:hypothetical protein